MILENLMRESEKMDHLLPGIKTLQKIINL
jgi:hypothetical protein